MLRKLKGQTRMPLAVPVTAPSLLDGFQHRHRYHEQVEHAADPLRVVHQHQAKEVEEHHATLSEGLPNAHNFWSPNKKISMYIRFKS